MVFFQGDGQQLTNEGSAEGPTVILSEIRFHIPPYQVEAVVDPIESLVGEAVNYKAIRRYRETLKTIDEDEVALALIEYAC